AACGDDGTTSPTATEVTTLSVTSGPELTTGTTAPTTGQPTTTTGTATGTTTGSTTEGISVTGTTDDTSATTDLTSTTDTTDTGTTGAPPVCPEDTIVCDGDTAQVCDGIGGFKTEEVCPVVCAPDLGCAECVPGHTECQGDQIAECNDSGTGFDIVDVCDSVQGLACDPNAGACVGACAGLGLSYIGCDYYPTVLQQNDAFNNAPHEFAVAGSNTSDQPATVTITGGANIASQGM